jgi:hypothetical protein
MAEENGRAEPRLSDTERVRIALEDVQRQRLLRRIAVLIAEMASDGRVRAPERRRE